MMKKTQLALAVIAAIGAVSAAQAAPATQGLSAKATLTAGCSYSSPVVGALAVANNGLNLSTAVTGGSASSITISYLGLVSGGVSNVTLSAPTWISKPVGSPTETQLQATGSSANNVQWTANGSGAQAEYNGTGTDIVSVNLAATFPTADTAGTYELGTTMSCGS